MLIVKNSHLAIVLIAILIIVSGCSENTLKNNINTKAPQNTEVSKSAEPIKKAVFIKFVA